MSYLLLSSEAQYIFDAPLPHFYDCFFLLDIVAKKHLVLSGDR